MLKAEGTMITVLLCVYLLSSLVYIFYISLRREKLRLIALALQLLGFALHSAIIVLGGIAVRRIPLVYSYEFASAFAWGVCLIGIAIALKYEFNALGSFTMPAVTLLMLYASLQSRSVKSLMPALNSNWLVYHVSTVIVAYSAFCAAFILSLIFLLRDRLQKGGFWDKHLPDKQKLDLLSYRAARLGLVFLTVTIILGALWAEQAWGNYWTWDPKETWSLITWLIYAMYLHLRMVKGLRGKTAAIFAVVGFICVLFTYVGVNTLLPGLHSYA